MGIEGIEIDEFEKALEYASDVSNEEEDEDEEEEEEEGGEDDDDDEQDEENNLDLTEDHQQFKHLEYEALAEKKRKALADTKGLVIFFFPLPFIFVY